MVLASLQKEGFLLTGQRVVKAAGAKKVLRGGDGHHFKHAPLAHSIDTRRHQPLADPRPCQSAATTRLRISANLAE